MIKKILPAAACAMMLAACADEELAPVITFSELEIGSFPRLVEFTNGEYDLNDLGSTAVQYTVEISDDDMGNNTTNYAVFATFQDRNPDNGDQSGAEMQLRDIDVQSLERNENGLPEVTITIPSTEIVSTFGLDESALLPGDRVRFRTTVTKNNGTTFGSSNSSSAIDNAFQGLLDFTAVYTCPLADDQFSGDYTITVVDGENGTGFGPNFSDGATVTLSPVAGATTQRSFSTVVFPNLNGGNGFGPYDFSVEFVCTEVSARTSEASGLGCGGGSIGYGGGDSEAFDFNDDTSFDVTYTLFGPGDGGCGLSPQDVTLRFTRQ